MPNSVVNYDGSITASPAQLVYPETVEEIQAVLRDSQTYPGPVRAVGSYHSLTPCASSDGTMINLSRMTFRVKPIEAVHFSYTPRPVDELTQEEVDHFLDTSEGLICWTVDRTSVFQQRHKVDHAGIFGALEAAARRRLWNHTDAHAGHLIGTLFENKQLQERLQQGAFDLTKFLYSTLRLAGGITLLDPDKTVDYRSTKADSKYAFTFWAFRREQWLQTLREYLDFTDQYHKETGFRCNMPLGAYHIRRDTNSLLSYTYEQEVFSIDPIHASTNDEAWHAFLRRFNEFAYERKGIPLLNQSPFVERKHVEAACGERWLQYSDWVRESDPKGRMLNPFFADLLSRRADTAAH